MYLALLYGLLAIKSVLVDDFTALAEGVIGSVRVKPLTRSEAAILWGGKALYAAWFLALPAVFSGHSWAALAALWLTAEAVAGWTLAFMFQVPCTRQKHHNCIAALALPRFWLKCLCVDRNPLKSPSSAEGCVAHAYLHFAKQKTLDLSCNKVCRGLQVAHVVGDVEFLQADQKTGKVPRGWAAAQVATSADFAHGSWFWTHLSGGLNYQVAPQLSQVLPACLVVCRARCKPINA